MFIATLSLGTWRQEDRIRGKEMPPLIAGGRKKAGQEGTLQEKEIKKTGNWAAAMNLAFYGMGGVDRESMIILPVLVVCHTC